jgi:acyl-coenzyme A synthetase/AMP-(fatty) acid ligase
MTITFPEQFNMATYYLDDRIKEGLGGKVAVYCADQQYTYADVQRMANQVGNVLLGLGVEMEDRVLIVLPDSIEFVATWFAVAKVGAIITMVNMIVSQWQQAARPDQRANADHWRRRAPRRLGAGAAFART